jgi:nitrite reductase/ring-hydroxylating ferredoxin subunit
MFPARVFGDEAIVSERDEERRARRVHRLMEDTLAGRNLKVTPSDAAERETIRAGAALAGARQDHPRMSAAFRRRLSKMFSGQESPTKLTRRALLGAGLAVGGGLVCGTAGARLLHLGDVPRPTAPTRLAARAVIAPLPEVARWWDTGIAVVELVENQPRRVSAGSVGAFVILLAGQVQAVSAHCTHLPCELEWLPGRQVLNCPCHNWPFTLRGESVSAAGKLPPLPLVPVRVNQEGHVEVLGTQ